MQQQPRLHIPLNHINPATHLQPHSHQIALLVDLKMPREASARREQLHERECAVRARHEGGQRVAALRGAVGGIDVVDGEAAVVAVGDEDEGVVGADCDFGGGRAGRDGTVAEGVRDGDLAEADAVGGRVGDGVGGDGGGELGDDEEVQGPVGRVGRAVPEGGVAGAGAQGCLDGGVLDEIEAVVAVDADEVGAEVGEEEELAGGIEDGFVDVRGVLAVGDCAGAREGEGEVLERRDFATFGYVEGADCAAAAGEELACLCMKRFGGKLTNAPVQCLCQCHYRRGR